MENKLTIGSVASALAQTTGKSKKLCDDFVREFFRLAAETLVKGEQVKIKAFGTFKLLEVEPRTSVDVNTGLPREIAAHLKVVFTPSKELAAAINGPFEDFESVEIEDEIPDEILYESAGEESQPGDNMSGDKMGNEADIQPGVLEAGSLEEGEDDEITYEAYAPQTPVAEEMHLVPDPDPVIEEQPPVPLPVYEYEESQKSRFGIGFLTGALSALLVAVVIFMLGCFFDWWPVNFGSSGQVAGQQELVSANAEEPEVSQEEETPAPEPVYDTVSTTRYLTTIAREHYGNFNFWPYIYIENDSILGHPDRITPGTRVVVPPLSKYGVDPSRKEDVEAAKKKGLEIYARYK